MPRGFGQPGPGDLVLRMMDSSPVDPLEVQQHEDVEQFGAGTGTECVKAGSESAFELIGAHPVPALVTARRRG